MSLGFFWYIFELHRVVFRRQQLDLQRSGGRLQHVINKNHCFHQRGAKQFSHILVTDSIVNF